MGRTPTFDRDAVVDAAAGLFASVGYEATSVDDLVRTLNLHRGSLYNAFGSKRGLFVAALRRHVETALPGASTADLVDGPVLDLVLVAAIESGDRDPEVAALVRQALDRLDNAEQLLGQRLRRRLISATEGTDPDGQGEH